MSGLFLALYAGRLDGATLMREVAHHVLRELGLDYTVTLVSGGESGNYEIIMCDKPRGSWFTLKLKWTGDVAADDLAGIIRTRLHERLASKDRHGDRRPGRRGRLSNLLPL